jgi:archaellum component FlaC
MDDHQNSSHFEIGTDQENPDTLLQSDTSDHRVDKLSQRVTIIAILIPCLVCIVMVIGYFGIKKRFVAVQGSGEKEVQSLSKNIESSYSSLSVQFAKLDKTIQEKVAAIEKETASLKKDFTKVSASIKSLEASKSGKRDLKNLIAKLNKKFAAIEKNTKLLAINVKTLEDKIDQDLKGITDTISGSDSEVTRLKEELAAISASVIGREDLEIALRAEQQSYQERLANMSDDYKKKIAMAQMKLKELEKRLRSVEEKPTRSAEKPSAPAAPSEPSSSPEKPAPTVEAPTSGEIVEQDIQQ